jgi:hypothetical protein
MSGLTTRTRLHRPRIAAALLVACGLAGFASVTVAAPIASATAAPTHRHARATPPALSRVLHDAVAAAVGKAEPFGRKIPPQVTVGNSACGTVAITPAQAVQGGQSLTLGVNWTATTSTSGCGMNNDNCYSVWFGSCNGGYWLVGLWCSTLAATNLSSAQGDCDMNNIVVLTDDSSGPNNGGNGTGYDDCNTVNTLGSIVGGLPGTLECVTDGSANDRWVETWPTGSTSGTASGPYEESGTSSPFQPANPVSCPPSATDIANGAIPGTCAFVVMPLNFYDYCITGCVPTSESQVAADYQAVLFNYAQAPSISAPSSATVYAGSPVDVTVRSGGNPVPTIRESGRLPAGLHFAAANGTATITGTTSTTGTFPLTLTASNGIGSAASQPFTLTVLQPPPPPPQGYWLASADGHVGAAGDAVGYGGLATSRYDPVIGVAAATGGKGYWEATRDGVVGAFGSARFFGDLLTRHVLADDIVALAPTADGQGYWLIGADGGMFAFGDARYHGSLPGLHVRVHDVVGMVATPNRKGYLLVGSDGGVFVFGGTYHGSLPGLHVRVRDIVGIIPTGLETGYVLVGADGGAFVFGRGSGYEGSLPGQGVHVHDVVGLALTPDQRGYWMAEANGAVHHFGDARALAEPSGVAANLPVVSIAAT